MILVITAMVLLFGVGMVAWLMLYTNYSKLLWDVKNNEYKTPLIRLIVRKYVDCKKLDINVRNVKVFVEKSIVDYEFCGLEHRMIEKLARSMEYFIMMLAVLSALLFRSSSDEVYMCMALGAVSTIALHLCRKLADIEGMQRNIVIELVDYLENSGSLLCVRHKDSTVGKLSKKAHQDFMRLNRCFDRIYKERNAKGNIAKM